MGPLFQIFLIFQLLPGGVTNVFSCTKFLVVSCRRDVNYVIVTNSHTWWGKAFFWKQMLKLDFLNFEIFIFSFFRLKCLSTKSQQGMELVSNVYLWPIPPSLAITPFWPNEPFTYEVPHFVVVTKKPPMFQIMRSSLYCMNGSIEDRHINWKNSYVCNSNFIARSVLLEFF